MKHSKLFLSIIVTALLLSGCDKKLIEELRSTISPDQFYKTDA